MIDLTRIIDCGNSVELYKTLLIIAWFFTTYFLDFSIDPSMLSVPMKIENAAVAKKNPAVNVKIMRVYLFGKF